MARESYHGGAADPTLEHLMSSQCLADLQQHHTVDGAHWVDGPGGPILEVKTDQCEARLSAYAAHVATWTPTPPGASRPGPGLFCSPRTVWGGGKAIRGGVPICWPWFGPRANDSKPGGTASPAHGFVRTRPWFVEGVAREENGRIQVTFLLVSDDDTLDLWPHAFEARLVASLGQTLAISLVVKNVDDTAFDMEGALHTYLTVSDVAKIRLTGLEGTRYFDKVAGIERVHGREALTLSGETDAVFIGTRQAVTIEDPGLSRTIRVEKSGSLSTVVWNPWLTKATAMSDLGGDAWRSFVCVEAANVAPHAVSLSPGATHTLSTRISIMPSRTL
jgi:glucose-6-phosphate 1-epimerase